MYIVDRDCNTLEKTSYTAARLKQFEREKRRLVLPKVGLMVQRKREGERAGKRERTSEIEVCFGSRRD